jgi:hypothetical protein
VTTILGPLEKLKSSCFPIGLPKEHSTAIGRVYADNFSGLADALKRRTLKMTKKVEVVDFSVETIPSNDENTNRKIVNVVLNFWSVHFGV